MNRFASVHPAVAAVYFAAVLTAVTFVSHPLITAAMLLGGIGFSRFLKVGGHGWYCLMALAATLTNPLFSHNGVTPLFFLNDNPVTLEAVLYGVQLGLMLWAVLCWFACFHRIFSADKLMFLCGKVSAKLALLISLSLRFVPLFKRQAVRVREAQQAMGLYRTERRSDTLRSTLRVYAALLQWALEYAIDIGASMKARGYGLPHRSHYARYRFCRSDALLLILTAVFGGLLMAALGGGHLTFDFYPTLTYTVTPFGWVAIAAAMLLGALPTIMEGKEAVIWRCCISKT